MWKAASAAHIQAGEQRELKVRYMRFQGLEYVNGNHLYKPRDIAVIAG